MTRGVSRILFGIIGAVLLAGHEIILYAGEISGRVTSTKTGAPLVNIPIEVVNAQTGNHTAGAVTNSQGRYTVDVPAGAYKVRIGYQCRWYLRMFYDNSLSPEEASVLSVEENQKLSNVNFRLPRGGIIRGKVAVNNRPAPGLMVQVQSAYDASLSHFASAETDAEGQYRIEGLPENTYLIQVMATGQNSPFIGGFYHQTPEAPQGEAVAVPLNGEVSNINFELAEGGTIMGSVLDERLQPIAEAWVRAVSVVDNQMGHIYHAPATRSNGAFIITGLPAGDYYLTAAKAQDGYGDTLTQPLSEESIKALPKTHVEAADRVRDVKVLLTKNAGLIKGQATDLTGNPLNGSFGIRLQNLNSDGSSPSLTWLSPGSNYQIVNLQPGRYQITIWDSSSQKQFRFQMGNSAAVSESLEVTIEPGSVLNLPLRIDAEPVPPNSRGSSSQ